MFSKKLFYRQSNKGNNGSLDLPSTQYVDLTLQPSGSTYTAPAHGYYVIRGYSQGDTSYITSEITNYNAIYQSVSGVPQNYQIVLVVQAVQGYEYRFGYERITNGQIRFVYMISSQ